MRAAFIAASSATQVAVLVPTTLLAQQHYQNFLDAMRSRNAEDLKADIREGHLSSAMCHMGNVSHLLGKTHSKAELDAMAGKNAHTAEAWQRMHKHLVKNGVDVDTVAGGVRMGPRLTMDPKTERFADAAFAAEWSEHAVT